MTNLDPSPVSLRDVTRRLNEVLVPWGFRYEPGKDGCGSPGAYANGRYVRGSTRISLIWRTQWGLGLIEYQHEDELPRGSLSERITWGLGHRGFMEALGHGNDCWLRQDGVSSTARNGGDPVTALLHDLREFAAPTLASEGSKLASILRSGYRQREVR